MLVKSLEIKLLQSERQDIAGKEVGLKVNSIPVHKRAGCFMDGPTDKESCYEVNSSESIEYCGPAV